MRCHATLLAVVTTSALLEGSLQAQTLSDTYLSQLPPPPPTPVKDVARQPQTITDVIIVIDSTSSMRFQCERQLRMHIAQWAVFDVIDVVPEGIPAAVVALQGDAFEVRPLKVFNGDERSQLRHAVMRLKPTGQGELKDCFDKIDYLLEDSAVPLVVMVTDGWDCHPGEAHGSVAALQRRFGDNWHFQLIATCTASPTISQLRSLAEAGAGNFYPVTSSGELSSALSRVREVCDAIREERRSVFAQYIRELAACGTRESTLNVQIHRLQEQLSHIRQDLRRCTEERDVAVEQLSDARRINDGLRKEITELKRQLAAANSRIEGLVAELDKCRSDESALKTVLEATAVKNAQLIDQIAACETALADERARAAALAARIKQLEQQVADQDCQMQLKEARVTELQAAVDHLKAQHDAAKAMIVKLNDEVAALESRVQSLEAEAKQRQAHVEDQQKRISGLEEQVRGLEEQVRTKNRSIADLTRERDGANATINVHLATIDGFRNQRDDAKNRVTELETAERHLTETVHTLETEKAALTAKNDTLNNKDSSALPSWLACLLGLPVVGAAGAAGGYALRARRSFEFADPVLEEKARVEERLAEREKTNQTLTLQLKGAEHENGVLKAKVAELVDSNARLEENMTALDENLTGCREERIRIENDLKCQVAGYGAERTRLEREIAGLHGERTSDQQELADLQARYAALQQKSEALDCFRKDCEREQARLEKQLECEQQQARTLANQLAASEEQRGRLDERLKHSENERSADRENLGKLETAHADLQRRNEELERSQAASAQKCAELAEQLKSEQQRSSSQSGQLAESEEQRGRLDERLRCCESELSAARESLGRIETAHSDLQRRNRDLEQSLATSEQERAGLKEQLDDNRQRQESLVQELADLKAQRGRLEEQLQNGHGQRRQTESDLAAIKVELSQAENRLAEGERRLAEMQRTLNETREQLSDQRVKSTELEKELDCCRSGNESLRNQYRRRHKWTRKAWKQDRRQLDNSRAEVEDLRRRIEEARTIPQQIQDLTVERDVALARSEQLQQHLRQLEGDLSAATRERNEFELRVTELQDRLNNLQAESSPHQVEPDQRTNSAEPAVSPDTEDPADSRDNETVAPAEIRHRDFPGMGAVTKERLSKAGVQTLDDLAILTDEQCEAIADRIRGVTPKMLQGWRDSTRNALQDPA